MSELRYRGEYGHVRGVDDASRYGQAGPSTRDTSSQQANTISWQVLPTTKHRLNVVENTTACVRGVPRDADHPRSACVPAPHTLRVQKQ